jgi:hypothetical protein
MAVRRNWPTSQHRKFVTGFKDLPNAHSAIVDDRGIDLGKHGEKLPLADFSDPRAMSALNWIFGFVAINNATPQNDVAIPF